ncbi:MAG: DUF2712 domain-containing protein [Clostridia bacterium]|nr:DUF2712 domain-containing protein [Clostridia bacterium]
MFKRSKLLKLISVAVLLAIASAISFSTISYASTNDEIDYQFVIKTNLAISRYDDKRLRSTSNNDNAWKVNLEFSDEGSNTATMFSLGLNDYTPASAWVTKVVGTGTNYYSANDAADWAYVYLQAKDNNNVAATYRITGYWDEETGRGPGKE